MAQSGTVRVARIAQVTLVVSVICSVPLVSLADRRDQEDATFAWLREGPGVINHPVNIVPSSDITIPEGWPLNGVGALTCSTCHSELPAASGARGYALRDFDEATADAADFCRKCHTDDGVAGSKAVHWLAVQVAHVKAEDGRSAGAAAGQLDATSRRCLGCHDGVSASDSSYATAENRGPGDLGDPRRNHPIGVPYPSQRLRGHSSRFKPATGLPKEVRLPGGGVGCSSCHNLYSKDPKKLTVPVEGSRLCFTCHDMD